MACYSQPGQEVLGTLHIDQHNWLTEDRRLFRGCRQRLLRLPAPELIRRFLQHVLPSGFVRIRYYGLLANRCRTETLKLCREALGTPAPEDEAPEQASPSWTCPTCGEGTLRIVEWIGGRKPAQSQGRRRAPPCCAA